MKSKVFFIDFRKFNGDLKVFENLLLTNISIKNIFKEKDIIAVKIHFGEKGNRAYLKPVYPNWMCEFLQKMGYKPFLTDTNTLYKGKRSNSIDHLDNAFFNGFSYFPVLIADGLRGESFVKINGFGKILNEYFIASDIYYSDGIVFLTHFKGHELTGFGGSLKNIGMGCAAKKGKLSMHSDLSPYVDKKRCRACFKCFKWCNVSAIRNLEGVAFIDPAICVGCGLCLEICEYRAVNINWETESSLMQKKMVEYAYATVKGKPVIFVNFLIDISPVCDCYSHNRYPLTNDIGVLFSTDPVSIDRASYELVLKYTGYDPFKKEHPSIDSTVQLNYGEEIGLGKNDYELFEVI